MSTECTARTFAGGCFSPKPEKEDGDLVISASVGAGGFNRPPDVRTIQSALNEVDPTDGGPSPTLAVDGINGPLTMTAIANYQKLKLGFSDSRVDPNGPTLRTLNADRRTAPVASAGAPSRRAQAVPTLPPNPFVIPVIESLIPQIRIAIRAAIFHLDIARRHVTTSKLTLPEGPFLATERQSLRLIDRFFSLSKLQNPLPSFQRLRTAYFNMNVALNRNFEVPAVIAKSLFVINPKKFMEAKARAYTTAGGAFAGPKARNKLGLPSELIFFCENMATLTRSDQIMTAIHELAHYVSPASDPTVDPANGFFFRDTPRMDALQPQQKVRNAEHYAAFAFTAGVNKLD